MTFDEWDRKTMADCRESPNAYARRAFNAGVRSVQGKKMTDDDINEAIDTLARACNVENRQSVIQALRKLINSGGETATPSAENRPAQDDVRDAQRYRWLRNEHFPTADKPPVAQVVWKWQGDRHGSKWVNLIDGDDMERHIDAAIASQSAKEPQ